MVKKIKRDFQALLDGYKPALIMYNDSKYITFVESFPRYNYNDELIYFFQNNSIKEKFITQMNTVERDSYQEYCLIGLTLGYPRKSVEFFAKEQVNKKRMRSRPNQEIRIDMIWAGFRFITSLDILIEEARWMWETYKHPKAIENPMYFWSDKDNTYLSVPYGDYDRLEEVREYIMKERGMIVTNQ